MKRALRLPRTMLATLLTGAALLAGIAPATARADTAAVAVNVQDGATVYRIVFQIRRVAGDTVDETNAAVAYASCSHCQTVAISIQVLLLLDEPRVIAPENVAIAINVDCIDCQTLASAYQFLIGAGAPVHFTADGNRRIAQIRRALFQLRHSGLSIADVQRRVDELIHELGDVLSNDLVVSGSGTDARRSRRRCGGRWLRCPRCVGGDLGRQCGCARSAGRCMTAPVPTAPGALETAAPDGTSTVTPTTTPTASQTPSETPRSTPDQTATPTPDQTATPTPDQTPTPTPGHTETPTPDQTATPTPDQTATPTPDQTATPTPDQTATPTPDQTGPASSQPTTSTL